MFFALQNVFHQVGQYVFRPKFYKDAATGLVYIFDLALEKDRVQDLPFQDGVLLISIIGIRQPCGIGINRDGRLIEVLSVDKTGERLLRVFDIRGVEGCRNRQGNDRKAFPFQLFSCCLYRGGTSSNDDLVVGVHIGNAHAWQISDGLAHFGLRCFHGQHGAIIRIRMNGRHRRASHSGQRQVSVLIEHTGCPEGGQFSKAVAGGKIRLETRPLHHLVQAHAQGADGRLRVLGLPQSNLLILFFRFGKSRDGENCFR